MGLYRARSESIVRELCLGMFRLEWADYFEEFFKLRWLYF